MPRLLLGLSALLLFTACATLSEPARAPNVSLVDFQVADAGFFEQRYLLMLRVQNPNPVELSIRGMDYSLDLNGTQFARGVSDRKLVLPAYGEALVPVELISSLSAAVRILQQLGGEAVRYELNGGVAVGEQGRRLPFSYEGELAIQQEEEPLAPGRAL